jgi:hypothetical protein
LHPVFCLKPLLYLIIFAKHGKSQFGEGGFP